MQQPSLSCLHAGSFGVEDLHKWHAVQALHAAAVQHAGGYLEKGRAETEGIQAQGRRVPNCAREYVMS